MPIEARPRHLTSLEEHHLWTQQLGLKLVRTKALVRTLVIDHVERPSEN